MPATVAVAASPVVEPTPLRPPSPLAKPPSADKDICNRPGYSYCRKIEKFLKPYFYKKSGFFQAGVEGQTDHLAAFRPALKAFQDDFLKLQFGMRIEETARTGLAIATTPGQTAVDEVEASRRYDEIQQRIAALDENYTMERIKLEQEENSLTKESMRLSEAKSAAATEAQRIREGELKTAREVHDLAVKNLEKACCGCWPCAEKDAKADLALAEKKIRDLQKKPIVQSSEFDEGLRQIAEQCADVKRKLDKLYQDYKEAKIKLRQDASRALGQEKTGKVITAGLVEDAYTNVSTSTMVLYLATYDHIHQLLQAVAEAKSHATDDTQHLDKFALDLEQLKAKLHPWFIQFWCGASKDQTTHRLFPHFQALDAAQKRAVIQDPSSLLPPMPGYRAAAVKKGQVAVLAGLDEETRQRLAERRAQRISV